MRFVTTWLIAPVLLFPVCSAADGPELSDQKDRVSYSIGYQIGRDFKRQGTAIDPEAVVKGVQDALSGVEAPMSQEEMGAALLELRRRPTETQRVESQRQDQRSLLEGKSLLAENAKKPGVVTLPSGLQYKVIREGTGRSPEPTDTVTVNYRGTLIDGSEFDSSYRRGKPATFRVDGVIPGWTEALQLMKDGAKWQLFIPPELAYGDKRTGNIEPNSTLIFEVELISVKSSEQ